jgi:hypothetical protein
MIGGDVVLLNLQNDPKVLLVDSWTVKRPDMLQLTQGVLLVAIGTLFSIGPQTENRRYR